MLDSVIEWLKARRRNAAGGRSDVRSRILVSGLFDESFYRACYQDSLAGCTDPLSHFLEVGAERGYLPSPLFDPVLYRLLVPQCGRANPLLHHLESGAEKFTPPPLKTLFPGMAAKWARGYPADFHRNPENVERNRAYAGDMACELKVPFQIDGQCYSLEVPAPEMFLDRLRSGLPFAFARLPHGFWDALYGLEAVACALAEERRTRELNASERWALAVRLGAALWPNTGVYAEGFIDEVLGDIQTHAANPRFVRAVAFKGYPTWDEEPFFVGETALPANQAILRLFSRCFGPDDAVVDATVWKRWLIAGRLKELPKLVRTRPVILIASGDFAELGSRWSLDRFTHIRIPPRLSQRQRWDVYARAAAAVDQVSRAERERPVVLTQCGGSLAFWLITRLFAHDSGAVFIDLGQALNGWFFDATKDMTRSHWMRIYARSVIANCGLEPYYRRLMGPDYETWFQGLP